MSLLLCRQKAEVPFMHGKLNIGIWSEQELCYVIYHYPLLCLKDFLDDRLFDWIDTQLKLPKLADALRKNRRLGESAENQMLYILQECNYYDVNEVLAFSGRMMELKKCSGAELVHMEGRLLYQAEKYSLAYEKFAESIRMLDELIRRTKDEEEIRKLSERKAEVFCDMAVIKMRMFDRNKAQELLISSELTYYNKRAVRLRYLVSGTGELGDNEKAELDAMKEEAARKARESQEYQAVSSLFEKDSVRIMKDARQILGRWKNNYRKIASV
ncbi:MAG: hypothetical protein IJ061_00650 [Lachnospiraceae bacterium]|nr:hypothetical protein [Lachnospiraceae bacterium]